MSKSNEYIQTGLPNTERLSSLISMGRGINRTMAQYAEACGVSASTLSRIANGKITKPLSVDLLRKLVENAEHPGLISLDEMIDANGMQDKETFQAFKIRRDMSQKIMNGRVKQICSAVTEGLLRRNLKVKQIDSQDVGDENNLYFPKFLNQYDLVYNVEDEGGHSFIWGFFAIPLVLNKGDNPKKVVDFIQCIIEKYATALLQAVWMPQSLGLDKISFVFLDLSVYFYFIEAMRKISLGFNMTAVFVNSDNDFAREEVIGSEPNTSGITLFFNKYTDIDYEDTYHPDFSEVEVGKDTGAPPDLFRELIEEEIPWTKEQEDAVSKSYGLNIDTKEETNEADKQK